MRCEEAEENLAPFLLGSVDSARASEIDNHLDACTECTSRLVTEGDLMAEFALSVSQREAPPRIKQQLLSRIDGETPFRRWVDVAARLTKILACADQRVGFHPRMVAASALVLAIVFGGVWFDGRFDNVVDEKAASAGQMPTVEQGERNVQEMVEALPSVSPGAAVTVTRLSATEASPNSRGMIYVAARGTLALLTARDLPMLSPQNVYKVWLVKSGQRYDTGIFEVDSTGYGQHYIDLSVPLTEFDAIVISIERADGGEPAGESILKGDL